MRKITFASLIIIIILFNILIINKEFQNDTFFNIAIGEYIMENGIDMMDHFSIHEGLEYTYSHWAFDILIAKTYQVFGFEGIYIFTIIMGAIIGITLFWILAKKKMNLMLSFICTIFSLFLIQSGITARSQIITFLMFILEIYCIEEFLDKKKLEYLLYLFLISIIIANFHSAVWPMYFILFLPYIAEYILKQISFKEENERKKKRLKNKIEKLKKKNIGVEKFEKELVILENKKFEEKEGYKVLIKNNSNTKILIIFMVIMILSGLCTPTGLSPYTYIIKSMSGNSINFINEMQPIIIKDFPFLIIFILIYITIICFTKVKINMSDGCLFLGLLIMTITSNRYFYLLTLIGTIPFCRLLNEFIDIYNIDLNKKRYVSVFMVLIIAAGGWFTYINSKTELINEKLYPFEVAGYIKENLDVDSMRIYNSYNNGSCLMMYDIPVFIDSRLDVYCKEFTGREIFDDYVKTTNGFKNYEETFEEYNITHVLTYPDETISKYICDDGNYKLIYKDSNDNYCLYERLIKKTF